MGFKLFYEAKEVLKGGVGDAYDLSDIDKTTMKLAKCIEMEHTDDPKIVMEIIADHIKESGGKKSRYYQKLLKYVENDEIEDILKRSGVSRKEFDKWVNL
jgi:hypothetical protein